MFEKEVSNMKKILFALSLFFVITLTGCQEKPFESDVDGYVYDETDTIVFEFNNGLETVEFFRYTFDTEIKLFVNEDATIYNFKNINNYQIMSDEITKLLDYYKDTILYRSRSTTYYDDEIELSTGATESDYNLEKITHDGDVLIEDAFVVTENGVTMLINYSKFQVDGKFLLVPSYIQLFATTIHQEVSWEFLGANNEYSEESKKLISYQQLIVPTPMKTGVSSSFETLLETGTQIDEFTLLVSDSTENQGTWLPCTNDAIDLCIDPASTTLEVQIYEMNLTEVQEFYEVFFGGLYIDGEFSFINNGQTFILYEMEEVQVRDGLGEIIDVVNAKIRLN